MSVDIRKVRDMNGLIAYFAETLDWRIDLDDFDDIEDIAYDFEAEDIGLKEEAFAKIKSLRQLPPLVDGQKWGIFCVEFDSKKFEVTALRKILSGLIPKRRNSADHAVWSQQDLLFICFWGEDNDRTIGVAHFEDMESGLPQIKMISCASALEDFTQIKTFEDRLKSLKWPMNYIDHDKWQADWSSAFTTGYKQTIRDASTLTIQLAIEAQGIRNRILDILEVESPNGYVHLLYEKFRNTLIHDMTETQFADMYAQTVVYGLFSARCMDETQDDFSAAEAVECIPNTNPFLKHLMKECLGAENTGKLSFDELEIGNVVDLLMHTKTDAIIADFNRQTGGGREDPVIHFYEEFLTAYDKMQKVQRGVYYTPQPVVNFIVRAVDTIIKKDFGLEDGLASTATKTIKVMRQSKRRVGYYYTQVEDTEEVPAIQVLDPATGTGTFIRQTILQIYENFKKKNIGLSADELKKAWNAYVPEHLLPRINAFELMMAPYAVAHMKLAMVLKDTGYDFESEQRLNVYLTNSLEEAGNSDGQLTLWADPLATESIAANAVKKNTGICVVLGNPPYSGESANKNEYILALMDDYKKEPGGIVKLNEKNPKWLNDDYVKFIRFAQKVVSGGNKSVIAYINPHGFIANPTFRGMRWKLMKDFDEIYILDLHGNSNRKETAPDGSKDENVFDIQQGVCICIFVKSKDRETKAETCEVYHADLYGLREEKYNFLNSASFEKSMFKKVTPVAPDFLFHQVNYTLRDEYDAGFGVNELFTLGSVGVVTARDGLTLDFTKESLITKVLDFASLETESAREKYGLGKDVRDWRVVWAQDDIRTNAVESGKVKEALITPIMYRPFDIRFTVYTGTSRGFICYPRKDVMDQFLGNANIGLATGRSNKSDECNHFFVSSMIMEAKCAERTTQSALFPLYSFGSLTGITVNFKRDIVDKFSSMLGLRYVECCVSERDKTFNERDLFNYIYAVLNNNHYRDKYGEFLKSDFPKIPYTRNVDLFWKLSVLGGKLVSAHTMHVPVENDLTLHGDNLLVEKVKHSDSKVFINKATYFESISYEIWSYSIGGYQPLQRWFKDRKNRVLTESEVSAFLKAVSSIKCGIEIVQEIDSIYDF